MKRLRCRAWWPREGVAGAPAFIPRPLPSPALGTPLCLPCQPFRAPQEPSSLPPRELRVCLFLELLCTFPCSPAISPQGSPQESPKQVQVLSHLVSGTPVSALAHPVLRSTPQFTATPSGGASLTALSFPHQPGAQRAETPALWQVLASPQHLAPSRRFIGAQETHTEPVDTGVDQAVDEPLCHHQRGLRPLLARGELVAKGPDPKGAPRECCYSSGRQGSLATHHPSSGHPAPTFPDAHHPRARTEGDQSSLPPCRCCSCWP